MNSGYEIDFTDISPYGISADKKIIMDSPWLKSVKEAALDCLDSITSQAKIKRENHGKWQDLEVDDYSNILAFTGDRGTGKTTAMISFVNYIASNDKQIKDGREVHSAISNNHYFTLPMVDPSRISDGESLLGFIVAGMYNNIKKYAGQPADGPGRPDIDEFRKVAGKCIEVFQSIRIKSVSVKESMKNFEDDTDYISIFANTVILRKLIYGLVDQYIALKSRIDGLAGPTGNMFLVIPIDDLDTNIVNGYSVTEEIHHFLMLPNVIITMSVKMEQLADLVEQKFVSDYKNMLSPSNKLDAQPAEMSVKYLQKLIPVPQRFAMPQLHLHNLRNTRIKINVPQKDGKKEKTRKSQVVDYFMELIYRKTGIILTRDPSEAHALIPLNLRAMLHTIYVLQELDDVNVALLHAPAPADETGEKSNENRKKLRRNLERVESWLIDSISANAVPRALANIFRRATAHPIYGFCAFLVRELNQYSLEHNQMSNAAPQELKYSGTFGQSDAVLNILNASCPEKTISAGDVLHILDKMLEVNSGEGFRHFAAAVKMLFSLRLTSMLLVGTAIEEDVKKDGKTDADPDDAAPDDKDEKSKKTTFTPDYEGAAVLLGDLLVNPAVPLTRSGQEWIPNADLSSCEVLYEVDGQPKKEVVLRLNWKDADKKEPPQSDSADQEKPPQSTDLWNAQWVSFFLVAPYRILRNDLHLFPRNQSWGDRIPYLKRDDSPQPLLASFHWLGFVTSFLKPEEAIEKLLWMHLDKKTDGPEGTDAPKDDAKQAEELSKTDDPEVGSTGNTERNSGSKNKIPRSELKLMREIKEKLEAFDWPLPLHSIDFIHCLTTAMHNNRINVEAKDGLHISEYRDFLNFKQNLQDSFKATFKKTCELALKDSMVDPKPEKKNKASGAQEENDTGPDTKAEKSWARRFADFPLFEFNKDKEKPFPEDEFKWLLGTT